MAGNLPFRREMTFQYEVPRVVAPGIRRIVAGNPSQLTYKGTNTYLLGEEDVIVIDPGPDLAPHLQAILRATKKGACISYILISHTHKDHSALVPALKAQTGAEVLGVEAGNAPRGILASVDGEISLRDSFVDHGFIPDRFIGEGDVITAGDISLDVLETPGHAPDHLCFALQGARRVFTGDHVMSWNTTMVAPPEGTMAAYMKSLEKLLPRNDIEFFPGHGGRVTEPRRVVKTYLMHRKMRESAILGCIKQGIGSIEGIVEKVYKAKKDSISSFAVAASSVYAHVVFLHDRGIVTCDAPFVSPNAFYVPVP